jgi:hypothetical protein
LRSRIRGFNQGPAGLHSQHDQCEYCRQHGFWSIGSSITGTIDRSADELCSLTAAEAPTFQGAATLAGS